MPNRNDNWLLKAVDSHWAKYRKRLKSCHREAGEEAVHKLRISTRRLLSLIELMRVLAPQASLAKLRKAFKEQLDGFDALRDTQVMRLEIAASISTLPELGPFLEHLQATERQLLQITPTFIKTLRSSKLRRKLQKGRNRLKPRLTGRELASQVLAAIDSLYYTALQRYRAVAPEQPETIHHLRISVKKLRYLISAANEVIPGLPKEHPQRLQNYLTSMGDIQNSVVLLTALDHFYGNDMPPSISQYYQQRHSNLLKAYMAQRNELLHFWRADAESPFPWQD